MQYRMEGGSLPTVIINLNPGETMISEAGGRTWSRTELAKKDEFYSIYWSEYNLVKESGSSELREMPDYLNQDRPSFEARA